MSQNAKTITRRTFLNHTASLAVGATALRATKFGLPAFSYGRILGSDDRISLGHVGIGNRGSGLQYILSQLKESKNVEVTTLCDLWKVNRERAAGRAEKTYGRAPRAFQYLEDMLKLKDVDAVLISTPEHQHSMMLKMVAEAEKLSLIHI